jgi:membrane protease YdiL (CAAX protease family)
MIIRAPGARRRLGVRRGDSGSLRSRIFLMLAPLSVSPNSHPGGMLSLVAVAMVFGLCWGGVAYRTGSIRWVVVSHVLLDFPGLGALVHFG